MVGAFMDAAAIRARHRRLLANASVAHALARELRAQTRAERNAIRALVQARPARGLARLARGGSSAPELPTWTGDGLKETRERACPHCGERAIAPRGHVRAVDGEVKAMYACGGCERVFVLVLTLLK